MGFIVNLGLFVKKNQLLRDIPSLGSEAKQGYC